MFILISVTKLELEINTSYHNSEKEAIDAMAQDIIMMTEYKSLDDLIDASNSGESYFSDDGACFETKQYGTGQWKIEKIPDRS
jgi:hypothetical protein